MIDKEDIEEKYSKCQLEVGQVIVKHQLPFDYSMRVLASLLIANVREQKFTLDKFIGNMILEWQYLREGEYKTEVIGEIHKPGCKYNIK